MKSIHRPRNEGSMLIITVCMAVVIGLGLVSYLWLVHSKNKLASRSLHWNMAMAHAEAGVEEALAQLNHIFGTNVNRAANGWGGPTDGVYGPVQRNLKSGAYSVTISTDPYPIIRSTGYATNPISGTNPVVQRTVEVSASISSVFQVGMAAKLNVTFKGNNVTTDSFNSADSSKSTNSRYDPTKAQANGDVASTDGFVSVGNANIHGKIRTGPSGTYSFGPNGYAGPILKADGSPFTGPGLYSPDWYKNDFNADFKDVEPPFAAGYTPTGSGTNKWILSGDTDYYVNDSVKFTDPKDIILVTGGNVRLYVTGDFELSGTAVVIEPGATLKLYVGTSDPSVSTKAELAQVNIGTTGKAATFQYYGLPSNKTLSWSGNDFFIGTVYAPQAVFTMGGGGNNTYDYQGACVVYEAEINGHFNFHYDEDLNVKPPIALFVAGTWREL